ncbi:uncharacterized protein PHACADRAFT_30792 [Phanerochaete carnosa HHB-10118-sp]|uniref:Uncharacterized protein n=1 Tax=Phanerochaete carnosa (strain HHB-10118-sp) TaxID=650164 RepID=K5VLG5_PHACS|nr:uncharacterized protein PHACADRAFT_30792 [Phanerochaete carnosa HHB-10118-sp]EKM52258.1 hypothetical protein PHACADRAFT_30792 [Phanerochaete carnosa HHB-10118-sp]
MEIWPTSNIGITSTRRSRKICGTQIVPSWFLSSSAECISTPPSMPADCQRDLQQNELYIHFLGCNTYQAWRCDRTDPVVWFELTEGKVYELPDEEHPRAFIVTESGLPSWVLPHTVEHVYKRLRHVNSQDAKGKSKVVE